MGGWCIGSACSEGSMTSDLHARLADAARTALEVVSRERGGDLRGVVDLVTGIGRYPARLRVGRDLWPEITVIR
jgi:hypothetical protein